MIERRKYIRLSSSVNITYKRADPNDKHKVAACKDIGGGGICLAVDTRFSPGTVLELKILLPGEEFAIPATGQVVWVDAEQTGSKTFSYYAGIKFTSISS